MSNPVPKFKIQVTLIVMKCSLQTCNMEDEDDPGVLLNAWLGELDSLQKVRQNLGSQGEIVRSIRRTT